MNVVFQSILNILCNSMGTSGLNWRRNCKYSVNIVINKNPYTADIKDSVLRSGNQ